MMKENETEYNTAGAVASGNDDGGGGEEEVLFDFSSAPQPFLDLDVREMWQERERERQRGGEGKDNDMTQAAAAAAAAVERRNSPTSSSFGGDQTEYGSMAVRRRRAAR